MADSNDLSLPSLQRLQSAEQMELLNVVDSLRALGLSEIVNLPQLIVCGDQSSGKSSVLEAISGIPFPRQDNLCTRFATEVILRRAPKDDISVTIVPAEDRTSIEREKLSQFGRDLKTKEDFKGLFEVARDAMGLTSTGKSFSNDILRVTFCGPSQPQLTLVDLPGLIHSETKSQTAADVKLVHNLVSGYLQNPRSIVLAVVSAKNDIGNQIILRRAREVDPQGLRTLGIITKPDLLVRGSKSEEAFIALARNEDVKFTLGWHVVKNLDASLPNQDDSRDEQEKIFFQESSFNCLPAHIIGINFLRARLSKVLFNQIRTELPRLVGDIESQIATAQGIRDKLGPSRKETDEQRSFLITLSQNFQAICRDAAKGDYDHEFFQDDLNPERRLCANVMNMHFEFAKNIRENGAYWLVGDNTDGERCRTREEAINDACKLLKRSRGRELPGLPNPLLVGELFRQYSRPWGDLARNHIKNVWEATNRFFELLLQHLTDVDVYENLFRHWLYPIMEEKRDSAYAKLDELLEVHKDHPMTTNSRFINNRKDSQQNKNNSEIEGSNIDADMDMVAAEEAFDNMNMYYEVALNLFTDNVPTLAVQGPIIREIPKIFCPTAVFDMKSDMVKQIAGESEEKILERENVLRRLRVLQNGSRICKQYAKRPQALVGFTSNDSTTPETPLVGGKGTEKDRATKSSSTRRGFPDSLPDQGVISNPFNHLSASTSIKKGISSEGGEKTKPSTLPFGSASSAPSPSPNVSSGLFAQKPESATATGSLFSSNSTSLFGNHGGSKPTPTSSTATLGGTSLFANFGDSKPTPTSSAAASVPIGLFASLGDSKPAPTSSTVASVPPSLFGGLGASKPAPTSSAAASVPIGLFASLGDSKPAPTSSTAASVPPSLFGGLGASKPAPTSSTTTFGTTSHFGNLNSTTSSSTPSLFATSASGTTPKPSSGLFGSAQSTIHEGSLFGKVNAKPTTPTTAQGDRSDNPTM